MTAGRIQAGDDASDRAALIACALQMNGLGINQGKSGNVSLRCARGGR